MLAKLFGWAMRRREFISLATSSIACVFPARAQQSIRLPTIGFLGPNTHSAANEWIAAFVQRLSERGWVNGRTISIEYRWADGRADRLANIANEFVKLDVDVIVTSGTPAVQALQQATSTIPIVFATAGDPVGSGLVSSLARPGGNTTGLATLGDEVVGKRLGLLREVVPQLSRLAILGNVSNDFTVLEMTQVQTATRTLGIHGDTFEIRRAQDIAGVFSAIKSRADALYICTDAAIIHTNRVQINALALAERLPTMHGSRTYIDGGGLMSYGPNFPDLFRRSADYVDKILRGTKPSEIPVEQPTKFDLVLNLTTAKAIGLAISDALLARADEVID
jgi:ABC-type uncharacterized transport system substrate-binding protein